MSLLILLQDTWPLPWIFTLFWIPKIPAWNKQRQKILSKLSYRPKNREIKNFKPQKILPLSSSLEIHSSTPPPPHPPWGWTHLIKLISILWIMQLFLITLIVCIVTYLVDCTIQSLDNLGQTFATSLTMFVNSTSWDFSTDYVPF